MPLSTYMTNKIGNAELIGPNKFVAGDHASFMIVYTAGFFGIDDSGSIKICTRFASDIAEPQFDDPASENYVSVTASNGAILDCSYHKKNNIRPWGNTIHIRIVKGYLKRGDKITIHYGNPAKGCPGIRMQTFCEDTFEFKVLVDAFATFDFAEIEKSPTLKVIPGPAEKYVAVLPTLVKTSEPFDLKIKAEDKWGNPTTDNRQLYLKSNTQIKNLTEKVEFDNDTLIIPGLKCDEQADIKIDIYDSKGNFLCSSNFLKQIKEPEYFHYWGDLHGQSEETIGSNTAKEYFTFARDKAFLDVAAHQGNDFQITKPFWEDLNKLTKDFYQRNKFVTFPGYEYSANTALGGDHNIYYLNEGEQIYRSCHGLVYDYSDTGTDCHTTKELFDKLKDKESFVYAHVGGRYADLSVAKDAGLTPAIEIHSAWGTFEWLLHDALKLGLRPGVVANSDGHKGRPGASYPGASKFGSYGGLTCFLAKDLTREAIYESIKSRHHYATTGCRMFLNVTAKTQNQTALMGDIVKAGNHNVKLCVEISSESPIEKIDVFNGTKIVETYRPYSLDALSNRIKIIWSGAEYKGRGRETVWDGNVLAEGNIIKNFQPVNFWNPLKQPVMKSYNKIQFQSITTGGISGVEIELDKPNQGELFINTPLINTSIDIKEIKADELVSDAGGLDRKIKVYRLPETNNSYLLKKDFDIDIINPRDNPLYVKVTREDGHMAWSSPIYFTQ